MRPTSSGARARANSSWTTQWSAGPRPRPPYAAGHATPTHRPPASVDCHSRKKATSESRSSKRAGRPTPYSHGRLACSYARTSWRSASWSAVGERSTDEESTDTSVIHSAPSSMDFELSDDQRALQEAAADLLGSLSTTERVRATASKEEAYDAALWKAMVDQGWTGVELSEEQGGLGLGMVEAAVLAEQVGAHLAPAPFIENLLAAGALAAADQHGWVERLVSGDAIASVAWRRDIPVPYAPVADVAVVIDDDKEEVLLVDLTAGPAIAREPAMDLTRPLGWLRVDTASATKTGGQDDAKHLLD